MTQTPPADATPQPARPTCPVCGFALAKHTLPCSGRAVSTLTSAAVPLASSPSAETMSEQEHSGSTEKALPSVAFQQQEPEPVTDATTGWENFYGLGWFDVNGRPHLTTWAGDLPVVTMLSVDCAPRRIPLWNDVVPAGAKLIPMPDTVQELDALVRSRCARRVIGWRMDKPIERKPWHPERASVLALDPSRSTPEQSTAASPIGAPEHG